MDFEFDSSRVIFGFIANKTYYDKTIIIRHIDFQVNSVWDRSISQLDLVIPDEFRSLIVFLRRNSINKLSGEVV